MIVVSQCTVVKAEADSVAPLAEQKSVGVELADDGARVDPVVVVRINPVHDVQTGSKGAHEASDANNEPGRLHDVGITGIGRAARVGLDGDEIEEGHRLGNGSWRGRGFPWQGTKAPSVSEKAHTCMKEAKCSAGRYYSQQETVAPDGMCYFQRTSVTTRGDLLECK